MGISLLDGGRQNGRRNGLISRGQLPESARSAATVYAGQRLVLRRGGEKRRYGAGTTGRPRRAVCRLLLDSRRGHQEDRIGADYRGRQNCIRGGRLYEARAAGVAGLARLVTGEIIWWLPPCTNHRSWLRQSVQAFRITSSDSPCPRREHAGLCPAIPDGIAV